MNGYLHSVRSEWQFCEKLDYNLLYRWFRNMDVDEPSFDNSTFSFNRERERPPDRARVTVDRDRRARQRVGRVRAQAAGMSAGTSLRRTRRESLGRTSARYSTGLMSASAQHPSTV